MIRLRWISSKSNWTAAAALADTNIGGFDPQMPASAATMAGQSYWEPGFWCCWLWC